MSLDALLQTLVHGDTAAKIDAAETLGHMGDRKATGRLTHCLRDDDPELRAVVCEALGRLGDPRAVPPLVSMLRDAEEDVRGEAFSALFAIGEARSQKLPDEIHADGDPANPSAALTQIVWPADLEAVTMLVDALGDEDAEVRIGAAYTLGRLGIMGVFPQLSQMLASDPDGDVRAAAAFALGDLGQSGDVRAGPELIKGWYTVGADDELAVLVVRSLADLGPPEALPVFEGAARHRDERVRQLAAIGLGRVGADPQLQPRAVGALTAALQDPSVDVRRIAAGALARTGSPHAVVPLVRAVVGESAEVRAAVGEALGRLDRATVHHALGHAIVDPDPGLRKAAAYLMGRIGDAEGLARALADPDVQVRKSAALAMGNIGRRDFRPLLERSLGDPDHVVRVACAEGLRRMGDPAALPALRQAAGDPNPIVRNAVQSALRGLETAR